MSEPAKLDISDWFQAGIAALLAVIGSVLPWMLGKMKTRRIDVDTKLANHSELLGQHVTKLAVLETERENVAQQLNDIKEGTGNLHAKIDSLIITLMQK